MGNVCECDWQYRVGLAVAIDNTDKRLTAFRLHALGWTQMEIGEVLKTDQKVASCLCVVLFPKFHNGYIFGLKLVKNSKSATCPFLKILSISPFTFPILIPTASAIPAWVSQRKWRMWRIWRRRRARPATYPHAWEYSEKRKHKLFALLVLVSLLILAYWVMQIDQPTTPRQAVLPVYIRSWCVAACLFMAIWYNTYVKPHIRKH